MKKVPTYVNSALKVGQFWGWLIEDGMKIPSEIYPPTNLLVRYGGLKYKYVALRY